MAAFGEHSRRMVCRLAFVGLCVVPTLSVVVWASWQQLPWCRMSHEEALSRQLGLRVTVAEVCRPRPRRVVYRQVVLGDAETGQKLALLPELKLASTSDGCIAVAPEVRVSTSACAALGRHISERLRTLDQGSLRFAGTDLRSLETPSETLARDVRLTVEAAQAKAQVDATFRVDAPHYGAAPVTVRIVRDRAPGRPHPQTSLLIQTQRSRFPCGWAARLWPAAQRLGAGCHFRGEVSATKCQGPWNAEFHGELLGVDLTTLVSHDLAHRLTGRADVKHLEAHLVAGRWQTVTGRIQAGPGVIGQPLVDAATRALGLRFRSASRTPPREWTYQELAARFSLSPSGLVVEGACGVKQPGVLLYGEHGTVMGSDRSQPVPTLALVRLMASHGDVMVPATAAAQSLARWLPVPPPRQRVARQRHAP